MKIQVENQPQKDRAEIYKKESSSEISKEEAENSKEEVENSKEEDENSEYKL